MTTITGTHIIGFSEPAENRGELFRGKYLAAAELPYEFQVADREDVDNAATLALQAFATYKNIPAEERARFLRKIAENILALGDELLQVTARETSLAIPRLTGERQRTVNQLNMFADLITEGSWVNAIIETADPSRTPLPKPDTRQMQVPLGVIAVFGASNFPYAFSVAGGDTAAALAAGCPVICKAHSAHPATSEMVGICVRDAAISTGMPDGVFSLLHGNSHDANQALVAHQHVKAVAFTGSYFGGKTLFDVAAQRPEPIPVYAEMGSVNPVFILPGIQEQAASVAEKLAASNLLGVGQFCTNPGILVIQETEHSHVFMETYARQIGAGTEQCMLYPGIASAYQSSVSDLIRQKGLELLAGKPSDRNGFAAPLVMSTTAETFMEHRRWHEEVFGPFSLIVVAKNEEEMKAVAASVRGQLTITLWGNVSDSRQMKALTAILLEKTGRIIVNGVPTGVEVGHAMVHGGPFPSTTDSRATSVGTQSIYRFTRPVCFQDFPDELLPTYLQNSNPEKIWRKLNGKPGSGGVL